MTGSALIVAAPGSGHGKTLVTAGLAKALLDSGKTVRIFKMGPDYLDPAFLEHATGLQVRQLDYWMQSREEIQRELARGAREVDHILIEGVMGLFDGEHSVAKLAKDFALPVLMVADASAQAQTFGALIYGLSLYDEDVDVVAVLANKVGSPRHANMLEESIRPPTRWITAIHRDPALAVHERHLGIDGGKDTGGPAAAAMAEKLAPALEKLPWKTLDLLLESVKPDLEQRLKGKRIAIARDPALNFLYHANIDFLQRQGAEVSFFSILNDSQIPDCDALYLPGGYPELHAKILSDNTSMRESVAAHIHDSKTCVAECGGMLYLQQSLQHDEQEFEMLGVFNEQAVVQPRLAALGYQHLPGTSLRGHTFHYAKLENDQQEERSEFADGRVGEGFFRYRNTVASFVHWYFSSDPDTICAWFNGCNNN
jgi:cobyrinic acid a,c-diamide synthase